MPPVDITRTKSITLPTSKSLALAERPVALEASQLGEVQLDMDLVVMISHRVPVAAGFSDGKQGMDEEAGLRLEGTRYTLRGIACLYFLLGLQRAGFGLIEI